MNENEIAHKIIGAAIEVHKVLGPGLLESAYNTCLLREPDEYGLACESEVPLAVQYKGVIVTQAYRADLLVENKVLVELKTVNKLTGLHRAQLLTYLRLSHRKLGLLINFNELILKNGISRTVNNL
jgi:GxxExxY protein